MREEWRHSRQGKKVLDGRCGQPDEAKPVPGQTCPIETAPGELPSNVVKGTLEARWSFAAMSSRWNDPPQLLSRQVVLLERPSRANHHSVSEPGSTLTARDRIRKISGTSSRHYAGQPAFGMSTIPVVERRRPFLPLVVSSLA